MTPLREQLRTRRQRRQDELNAYVIEELKELRRLIQQQNSEHARARDELYRSVAGLPLVLDSRTAHLGRGASREDMRRDTMRPDKADVEEQKS